MNIFYFFLFREGLSQSSNCMQYVCGDSSPYCVSYNSTSNTNTVGECGSGQYCPYNASSFYESVSCSPIPAEVAYPGEACKQNSDCNMNMCINNTCFGYIENEPCTSTYQCNPGLFCQYIAPGNYKACIPLIETGNKGCYDSGYCVNVAQCNFTGFPQKSTCIGSLSLLPGTQISECIDGINLLCQFLYCITNTQGSYCTDQVYSIKTIPVKCASQWDCMSNSDRYVGGFYLGDCECGINPNGDSYCNLFPGDTPFSQLIEILTVWLVSPNITKCNSLRGLSPKCISTYFPFSTELFYYYYFLSLYPQIQNNPDCVQKTITYNFWDNESVLANRTVVSASIYLFVVFNYFL